MSVLTGRESSPTSGRRGSGSQTASYRGWRGLLHASGGQIVVLIVALAYLYHSITKPLPFRIARPSASPVDIENSNTTKQPGQLHFVVPASHADPNLCKLLVSAGILGYPAPTIINWNQSFDDNGLVEGGSHLAKITGVYEYLESLPAQYAEDLVLMVDGYDIWMQLRPQTLIDRYFALNKQADERIRGELGNAGPDIRQEIIFGCQKRCWPWTPDDPPCYAVPNSTLLPDVYGTRTDTLASEDNPFINYRPRFLNSGTGIGRVRAMRKLFGQALDQAAIEPNIGSDQYIFSHIFGDQEIWREALRRDARPASNLWFKGTHPKAFFNDEHIAEVREKAAQREDGNFEFGIGVDYGAEIVLNTVFAEEDTQWLAFANDSALADARESKGITTPGRGIRKLAWDILHSLPPFWSFQPEEALPTKSSWEDVPLLADVYTGNVPAVIHHNAHRDGLKSRRETWWPLVWFQKHARRLYDNHIIVPYQPLAISGYDEKEEWWSPEMWKGGARDGSFGWVHGDDGWLRFDEVCMEFHEEVFRDGLGPWLLPEQH